MINTENFFPQTLLGRLWHTTSKNCYKNIVKNGCILPSPPISDDERWASYRGAEYFPFVRSLGGISLFDFKNFEANKYSEEYPLSSWREFVPFRKKWGESIWIALDREKISENFISGENLLSKWKETESFSHPIMPIIEAAHIGPITLEAFECVYLRGQDASQFKIIKV